MRCLAVFAAAVFLVNAPALAQQPEQPGQQAPQEEPVEIKEEIVVTATRTDTRLQDQPLRVEVIDREDIEEKALMTPGTVAMLLAETSGLRVQTTAPTLGAANVRIQGLRGRYAQLLADGLPLYGAQGDSFSLLQVPPLDLNQVEVIKGAASALYGSSALGGVVNLVSRRPNEPEREVLVNRTSRGGTDVTAWLAQPVAVRWGLTLLGGYHGQTLQEIEEDGWADLAAFDRGLFRPRLFFDNQRGQTLFVTGSVMAEERRGGTLPGAVAPDGQPFEQQLTTGHADAGAAARWLTGAGQIVAARGSVMRQSRDRLFGLAREHTVQSTRFGELSIQGIRGRHTWVARAARFSRTRSTCGNYRGSTTTTPCRPCSPRTRFRWAAASRCRQAGGSTSTPNTALSPRRASHCSSGRRRNGQCGCRPAQVRLPQLRSPRKRMKPGSRGSCRSARCRLSAC